MRVLDDAEHVAEGIQNGREADTITHVLDAAVPGRPEVEEPRVSVVRVFHTPVGNDALAPRAEISGLSR